MPNIYKNILTTYWGFEVCKLALLGLRLDSAFLLTNLPTLSKMFAYCYIPKKVYETLFWYCIEYIFLYWTCLFLIKSCSDFSVNKL